jgi:hypothetical protein
MSTPTLVDPTISEFAAAVRAALSDLQPDEIEELTDGLEADLAERLADDGGEPGDPIAYAEELRTAAGLPHRAVARPRSSIIDSLRDMPASLRREVRALADRYPALDGVWRFLVSIRPAWWILRAVAVTWVLLEMSHGYFFRSLAPISGPVVLLCLALIVVSVQFGRGRWLPFAWMRAVLLVGNVLLAITLPFLVAGAATSINNDAYAAAYSDDGNDNSSSGLQLNGSAVSNVFAFDADGRPLSNVQLFDQDGKPLDLVGDPTIPSGDYTQQDGSGVSLVPNQGVPGRLGWNVFPLAHVSSDDITDDGQIKPGATPIPATLPFAGATPLVGAVPTGAPTPTPAPTGTPSPTATPTPPASPTPAP